MVKHTTYYGIGKESKVIIIWVIIMVYTYKFKDSTPENIKNMFNTFDIQKTFLFKNDAFIYQLRQFGKESIQYVDIVGNAN